MADAEGGGIKNCRRGIDFPFDFQYHLSMPYTYKMTVDDMDEVLDDIQHYLSNRADYCSDAGPNLEMRLLDRLEDMRQTILRDLVAKNAQQ